MQGEALGIKALIDYRHGRDIRNLTQMSEFKCKIVPPHDARTLAQDR